MTNEKRLESLSTEEKAEWLAKKCKSASNEFHHENQQTSWDKEFWKAWLLDTEKDVPYGVAEV